MSSLVSLNEVTWPLSANGLLKRIEKREYRIKNLVSKNNRN